MPLVTQAAGGQRERVTRFTRLGHGLVDHVVKAGAAVGCGENAVFVQARFAHFRTFRQRPLLRALGLQQGPAQAGDVEVTPTGAFAVFVPDGFGPGCGVVERVGEQGGGGAPWHKCLQPLRKVHHRRPVVACCAGCGHGGAHTRDTAFAVGHSADFFAPGGGRQQQVGKRAGGGGGKSLLHHHKLGALQRPAHGAQVGHALRGVGAGNPQCLDLSVGSGLEHLHGGFAGGGGHVMSLAQVPQRGHFGAVLRVGHVAVGAHQVGQTTDFAPTHGVGLAGE